MFSNIQDEASAYWLGFLSADGCIYTNKGWKGGKELLGLRVAAVDEAHLRDFAELVGSWVNGPYPSRIGRTFSGTFYFETVCYDQDIIAGLKANGVTPRKSFTLKPWYGPPHLMRHYWRGMMDGDGWISLKKRGDAEVGLVGTEAIARGFSNYLISEVGLAAAGVYPNKTVWRCQVGGIIVPKKVVGHLYEGASVFLPRKKASADLVMGLKEKNGYYDDLTAEQLTQMYKEMGSWDDVARSLGTGRGTIRHHRRRLGLISDRNLS